MAKKIPFTPASLDAIINVRILNDPLTPGLAIEVLNSGKKRWKYRRKIVGKDITVTLFGGLYPTYSIAAAREWAHGLNEQVEAGLDPREVRREEKARSEMTVAKAHELYMAAVHEGRASRAKRKNKPRTVADKLEIYNRDIKPRLDKRSVYEITERDLIKLVTAKGKLAKVRANRLAAELKVFFGWASSLRGLEVGLENDPSRRLGDLKFPESPRQRKLSLEEIEWFLKAVRLSAARLTLPIKRSYSLARDLPLAFSALKRTGAARFSLSADELRRAHPGTFGHRIRAVDVAVEAPGAFPVPRGMLRNLGLSYLSPAGSGPNLPLVRFEDALPISDFRTRADMAVHDMPGEQLMPFEGSGFATEWLIEFPTDQAGMARLTDVLLTFDVRCDYAGADQGLGAAGNQSRAVLLSGLALDTSGFAGLRDTSSSATLLYRMGELALPGPFSGSKITNIAVLLPGVDKGTVDASLRTKGASIDFSIEKGIASSNAGHLSDGVASNVQPLNAVAGIEAGQDIEIEIQKGGQTERLKRARDVVVWLEYEIA